MGDMLSQAEIDALLKVLIRQVKMPVKPSKSVKIILKMAQWR